VVRTQTLPRKMARVTSTAGKLVKGAAETSAQEGQTLATNVYQRIRDDILSGSLEPNTKLLMRELQERYHAGLSPIREALAYLHAEDLVCSSDHRGYWVAPVSVEEIHDLTRVRLLLEVDALRESIAKGDDAWESHVVATYHQFALLTERGAHRSTKTLASWEIVHEDFHKAIIAAASSKLVLRLRAALTQTVRRYRRFAVGDVARDQLGEHRAIRNAVVGRDADLAVKLLTKHYDKTTRFIVANFEETQA
jgi:GntR family carbon starvation induced transcriptional regulator